MPSKDAKRAKLWKVADKTARLIKAELLDLHSQYAQRYASATFQESCGLMEEYLIEQVDVLARNFWRGAESMETYRQGLSLSIEEFLEPDIKRLCAISADRELPRRIHARIEARMSYYLSRFEKARLEMEAAPRGRRRRDVETSQKRVDFRNRLSKELRDIRRETEGRYCTVATLKSKFPGLTLWTILNDSQVEDILYTDTAFRPAETADRLTGEHFGKSMHTIRSDMKKVRESQRAQK